MSTTEGKIALPAAIAAAEKFRALFPPEMFRRWVVAGSVRRERTEIGDIEHVVEPAVVEVRSAGLFGAVAAGVRTPLLNRLDELAAQGVIERAVYPDGKHRWGDRYRGVLFEGVRHELFMTDRANWGPILAIRTGPALLSQRLVTALASRGLYRQQDGYVRYAGGRNAGEIRMVATEEEYFSLCGLAYIEPRDRDRVAETRWGAGSTQS